jgi:beta-fructofuranosidase
VLRLPDSWAWDCWIADDGERFHLFFLRASRALIDPERRHRRASVGHAVSTDLRSWTLVADALVPSDAPAFDDLAIWTGSVAREPGGAWRMVFTGASRSDDGLIQRIGTATSTDLMTWERESASPIAELDPRWYERLGDSDWHDQAWRDPWLMADPDGRGWHLLVTARSADGPVDDRGVVGHAWSPDLETWETRPPLSAPGAGFGQLEVCQVEVVDGRPVLLFSCLRGELAASRRLPGMSGGVWAAPADGPLGPFHLDRAHLVTDDRFYAGRLVRDRAGDWQLLAFRNRGADGEFVGEISDPMPVRWDGHGRLTVAADAADAATSSREEIRADATAPALHS